MTHARALLSSTVEGCCDYLHAGLRDTGYILKEARRTLDVTFRWPSYCSLSRTSFRMRTTRPESWPRWPVGGGVAAYNALVPAPSYARIHAQVTGLFGDRSLIPPGVVPVSEWRPDVAPKKVTDVYAGIARKPARRAGGSRG